MHAYFLLNLIDKMIKTHFFEHDEKKYEVRIWSDGNKVYIRIFLDGKPAGEKYTIDAEAECDARQIRLITDKGDYLFSVDLIEEMIETAKKELIRRRTTMSNYGHFSDNPQTEWVTDPEEPDRNMKLLRDFSYTDPKGKVWLAPTGSVINGASIPRPLWSTVGSPYTDDYRNASIVHDVAVSMNLTPSERREADKMFYYACLAGGCSIPDARVLYLGVRIGSWSANKINFLSKLKPKNLLFRIPTTPRLEEEILMREIFHNTFQKITTLDKSDNFELLEALVDKALE